MISFQNKSALYLQSTDNKKFEIRLYIYRIMKNHIFVLFTLTDGGLSFRSKYFTKIITTNGTINGTAISKAVNRLIVNICIILSYDVFL